MEFKFEVVIVIIIGCVSFTSALECYSCSETIYSPDQDDIEMLDCSSPSGANVDVSSNCTGMCSTYIRVGSSFMVERECIPASLCTNCTSPSNCRLCCEGDRCNDEPVMDLLEEYRLAQFCYECSYSEIPNSGFDEGCGLNFDPEGSGVTTSICGGLCYSAVSYIKGVEVVRRGCRVGGASCDRINHPYLEDKSYEFNNLDYDMSCCLGSLCNKASTQFGTGFSFLTTTFLTAAMMVLQLF